MKRFILAIFLTLGILIGCTTVPIVKPGTTPGTIFITGSLYDSDFEKFYEQTSYSGLSEYRIILNTDGGSAPACTGIINRMIDLQKQGVRFITEVYSKAYSAGAFIYMIGDHRIMHRGSVIMFHTMMGQAYNDRKDVPKAWPEDTTEMFVGLDENIIRQAIRHLPNVDPMTLETMLRYSGCTFIMAQDANTIGLVDEFVEN